MREFSKKRAVELNLLSLLVFCAGGLALYYDFLHPDMLASFSEMPTFYQQLPSPIQFLYFFYNVPTFIWVFGIATSYVAWRRRNKSYLNLALNTAALGLNITAFLIWFPYTVFMFYFFRYVGNMGLT